MISRRDRPAKERTHRWRGAAGPATARASLDVADVLTAAHRRYDDACRVLLDVGGTAGSRALVEQLAADLLAHEALEQLLVHPVVAQRLPDGDRLASDRVHEEGRLDRTLSDLLGDGDADRHDERALARLHDEVVEHTEREEIEVFPLLRHVLDRPTRSRLGALYEAAHPRTVRHATADAIVRRQPDDDHGRRPLLAVRDVAAGVLRELGATIPPGVGTGTDTLDAVLPTAVRPPRSKRRRVGTVVRGPVTWAR